MNYISDSSSFFATFGVFIFVILLIALAVSILYIVGLWKLFKKAGKNGWEAIIPFYNNWVLVEISGLSWWYFLLIISPSISVWLDIENMNTICNLAALFAKFLCYYNISKKLHQTTGFAVLTTLFPVVMISIIGLSDNFQFDSAVPVSENGIFGGKQTNPNQEATTAKTSNEATTNQTTPKFCPNCGNPLDPNSSFCGKCGQKLK